MAFFHTTVPENNKSQNGILRTSKLQWNAHKPQGSDNWQILQTEQTIISILKETNLTFLSDAVFGRRGNHTSEWLCADEKLLSVTCSMKSIVMHNAALEQCAVHH